VSKMSIVPVAIARVESSRPTCLTVGVVRAAGVYSHVCWGGVQRRATQKEVSLCRPFASREKRLPGKKTPNTESQANERTK
jgi:hypothetical protein